MLYLLQDTCLAYPACLAVVWDNSCGYLKTSSATVDHGTWSTYIKVGGTSNASAEADIPPGTQASPTPLVNISAAPYEQPPSISPPGTTPGGQATGEGRLLFVIDLGVCGY
jgi:hypothetical protein